MRLKRIVDYEEETYTYFLKICLIIQSQKHRDTNLYVLHVQQKPTNVSTIISWRSRSQNWRGSVLGVLLEEPYQSYT